LPLKHPIQKGKKHELKVVHKICDALGLKYGEDLKRKPRGEPGGDVTHMTERAKQLFPFCFDAKDRRKLDLSTWWTKILKDTPAGQTPALVIHLYGENKDWVLLDLDDFLKIIKPKE